MTTEERIAAIRADLNAASGVARNGERIRSAHAHLDAIAARILEEHSKYAHKDMDWHKIAAAKVYEHLQCAPHPTDEQPVPDISKHYTAVLVNAIRMSQEEMTQLVKDLCDRGAHPPDVARLVEAGDAMREYMDLIRGYTMFSNDQEIIKGLFAVWDTAKATLREALTAKANE